MFLVGLLQWWYGPGWIDQIDLIRQRLARTIDFFSIGHLLATLFSPFRQISAGRVGGPIGAQFQAFLDKTISRLIGAMVRGFTIIAGLVVMLVQAIFGLLIIVAWLVIPALPLIGFIAFAIGWTPSWN